MPRPMKCLFFVVALLTAGWASGVRAEAEVVLLPDGTTRLLVDANTCQEIRDQAVYRQPAGVEYQPGVDSHGKPVPPADLGGGYGIDLAKRDHYSHHRGSGWRVARLFRRQGDD